MGIVIFLNGYFKFLWTSEDIIQTVEGEEKGVGKFKANVLEDSLKKSYTALSRKLGGKYYFDNSSKNKIIIRKIYFLDGQMVKATITFKDKDKRSYENIKFDDIVRRKDSISIVEISAINGKPLAITLQLNGANLGRSDFVTSLE